MGQGRSTSRFNRANAIELWLRRAGFVPADVTAWQLRNGYVAFLVEFEDGPRPAAFERGRYGAFLEDHPCVLGHGELPMIWPGNLRAVAKLGDPTGPCAHGQCDAPAEEHVIVPWRERVDSYCEYHADAARQRFPGDGVGAYGDDSPWRDDAP